MQISHSVLPAYGGCSVSTSQPWPATNPQRRRVMFLLLTTPARLFSLTEVMSALNHHSPPRRVSVEEWLHSATSIIAITSTALGENQHLPGPLVKGIVTGMLWPGLSLFQCPLSAHFTETTFHKL